MKVAIVFLALIVAVSAADVISSLAQVHGTDPDWPAFATFALRYKRAYADEHEADVRFQNFKAVLARNVVLSKANPLAQFGVNEFSDMSEAEFRATHLMPRGMLGKAKNITKFWKSKADIPPVKRVNGVPNDVDWVAKGATTAVKDQGQCGSCWAFSATEAIESAIFLAGSGLPTLAPEQIVDCDTSDGACNGGDPRSAMNYVVSAGGMDAEAAYPYTAGQSGQASQCAAAAPYSGSESGPQDVSDGDENALQSFLQNNGPPSICVDASSWQSYTGGVMTSCGTSLDHCVQATGITSQFGTPAYAVRNSWNTGWGVNGFIYLAVGQDTCGLANEVTWVNGASLAQRKHKKH